MLRSRAAAPACSLDRFLQSLHAQICSFASGEKEIAFVHMSGKDKAPHLIGKYDKSVFVAVYDVPAFAAQTCVHMVKSGRYL